MGSVYGLVLSPPPLHPPFLDYKRARTHLLCAKMRTHCFFNLFAERLLFIKYSPFLSASQIEKERKQKKREQSNRWKKNVFAVYLLYETCSKWFDVRAYLYRLPGTFSDGKPVYGSKQKRTFQSLFFFRRVGWKHKEMARISGRPNNNNNKK